MSLTKERPFNVKFSKIERTRLEELSHEKDTTKAAILRQALRLYDMIDKRSKAGERIYFESETLKTKKEIILLT